MEELKRVYRNYAITLMVIAAVVFGVIMLVANFYVHPQVRTDIPANLKVLYIVLLTLSSLGGLSVLLLKKIMIDTVSKPDFQGDRKKALFSNGILAVLPSLISVASGLTLVFLGIAFQTLLVFFYIFIGSYYLGYTRSTVWKDLILKYELEDK